MREQKRLCRLCSYCQPDKSASFGTKWIAYACANRDSMYYYALLNVNMHGDRLSEITWRGCEFFEEAAQEDIVTRMAGCARWAQTKKDWRYSG